jgi:hypothetical protein
MRRLRLFETISRILTPEAKEQVLIFELSEIQSWIDSFPDSEDDYAPPSEEYGVIMPPGPFTWYEWQGQVEDEIADCAMGAFTEKNETGWRVILRSMMGTSSTHIIGISTGAAVLEINSDGYLITDTSKIPVHVGQDVNHPDFFNIGPQLTAMMLPVVLWGLSRLHQRVELDYVKPTRQYRRRLMRKEGKTAPEFYWLRINNKRYEPGESHRHHIRPEHVVRGHFKHYSDAAPLFGKFAGTFWWDASKRGDSKLGQLRKGYKVK